MKPPGLVRPSNAELGDAPRYVQPFLHRTAAAFPDAPLWNPSITAGRPLEANGQSAVFSPFNLPAYVLSFWTALGWIAVLKLWVAAFGTYLLGRALGLRFGGALVAGLVFALNLRMVTWLSYDHAGVWALLPWLLLLTERLVRRPGLLPACGLAAVVALQFLSGHAESSFHVLLATAAFLALRLWQARTPPWPALLGFAAAVAGGAALAAVALVPFLELLWHSADFRDRGGQSIDVHLPTQDALGLFLPDYWGRPTQTPLRPFLLERSFYVGALPLLLAGIALIVRPRAERVAIAAFGCTCFAVAVGIPPFSQVVTRLPVFSAGHNTRLVVLTMLALALLAGWGLDELTQRAAWPRARRRAVVALGALLLLGPVAFVVAGRKAGPGDLVDAVEVAWLFRDAPTLLSSAAARGGHPACVARRVGDDGRRGARAAARAPARAPGTGRRRRARGGGRPGRPAPRGHGLQPGDRARPRRGARDAGHPPPAARPRRALRQHRGGAPERHPDAVRPARGPRLRPADRAPLRPLLAPRRSTRARSRSRPAC